MKRIWQFRITLLLMFATLLTLGAHARGRDHRVAAPAPVSVDDSWTAGLERMDHALARHDVSAAAFAWRDAYGAGLRRRRWDALIDLGDGALRMATTTGERRVARAQAGDLYLLAVIRADRERSLDGILRSARAFADIGDVDRTEQTLRLAGRLVAQDAAADAPLRLRAFREETAARLRNAPAPVGERTWLGVLLPDAVSGM